MADLIEGLKHFLRGLTPLQALGLGVLLAVVLLVVARVLKAWLRWVLQQPARKKISKAAETLERAASTTFNEMREYKDALDAFITQYGVDKAALSPALEKLKLEITRLALPKLDPAKFTNIKDFCFIHRDTEPYYRAFYNGVMLAGFCNLYREFFAQNNAHYLEHVEALVGSFYHTTPIKAHAEYITQKVPDKDADHAMHYFSAYAKLLGDALGHADALRKDLARIKSDNVFSRLLTWWMS